MSVSKTDKKYLTTICKKTNIELTQNNINKTYNLDFFIDTNHTNVNDIFTFDFLFNLLNSLDKANDFIESTHILNKYSDDNYDILIIFKHIGSNFGFLKKYLSFNLKKSFDENNNTVFNAVNINIDNNIIHNLDKVILHFADMTIINDKNALNKALIHTIFNIEIDKDLPKMMLNFVNLVMKNMVINLKQYIDTL